MCGEDGEITEGAGAVHGMAAFPEQDLHSPKQTGEEETT